MMENRKQPILIFISIIVSMSFFFQWIYIILTKEKEKDMNILDLLIDLPIVILMAFVSLVVVHTTNKHFKYKDNIYIRVIFEMLTASVFVIIYSLMIQYIFRIVSLNTDPANYLEGTAILLVGNIVIVLMLELFFYNQRQLESKKHIAVIEKERAEFLYATLKTQIDPHFLFNSLNVLSSLIFEDAQRANIYTKKLSNIYRYVLSTNVLQRVTVQEEMTFLESYIYLLNIRFENALRITINGNKDIHKYIIPVSLQILLENAIKHNIASKEQVLNVDIYIDSECIEITNNLQLRPNIEESGYGLNNLQKQYALHNKQIEIGKTNAQFMVKVPYL